MALNDTHFKSAPDLVETTAPPETLETATALPMTALVVLAVVMLLGLIWTARRGIVAKA